MKRNNARLAMTVAGALYVVVAMIVTFAFAQKGPILKTQDKIALGESEVKQLLLLMDTDKNGKISRKEYMEFMEKEFDRLDKDKSGELDPKELTQSSFRTTPFSSVGK